MAIGPEPNGGDFPPKHSNGANSAYQFNELVYYSKFHYFIFFRFSKFSYWFCKVKKLQTQPRLLETFATFKYVTQ